MIADVLVEIPLNGINKTFSYLVPTNLQNFLKKGMRVLVPFGNKNIEGFVLNIKKEETSEFELKNIIDVIDSEIVLNEELLQLGKYISSKTFCSLIKSYQTMLPVGLKVGSKKTLHKKYDIYIKASDNFSLDDFKGKQLEIMRDIYQNNFVY